MNQSFAQQADLSERIARQQRERIEDLNRDAAIRQTGDPVIADEAKRRELPPKGGPTVKLNSITFEPASAFLTDKELSEIRDKYIGKQVDFSGISELVRDVNDLYADKGIVTAAAILPPQELSNGELKIQLVEGQLGNVALVGEHTTRNDYILSRIRLAHGKTVDVPTAAKDLNFFNKTNQVQLRMLLRPGAAFGVTDVVLGITEPSSQSLQFFIDNEGTRSTGDYQTSVYYRKYGTLGLDDTFSIFATGSEGAASGTIRYDLPISPWGTRFSLGYTKSTTKVVAGPTAVLDIGGKAQSGTVTVTQPFIVDENWLVSLSGSAFLGTNYSDSAGVPLVDSKTTKYAPSFAIGYTNGNFSFNSEAQLVFARVEDQIVPSDTSHYLIGTGSLSTVYRFADEKTVFLASGAWQYTNEVLLPGNLLFQIGGPTTVRGYPSDGIAGDSGYYSNFELHRVMGEENQVDLFGFADIGSVYSTFPASQTLTSVGAGLSYTFNKHLTFKLTAAVPVLKTLADQSDIALYGSARLSAF